MKPYRELSGENYKLLGGIVADASIGNSSVRDYIIINIVNIPCLFSFDINCEDNEIVFDFVRLIPLYDNVDTNFSEKQLKYYI